MILLFALAAAVTIPRVDQGNILSWQVASPRTLYLEDREHNWYRADTRGPCVILNLNEQLGFRTGPGGRLDANSQLITRAGRCPIKTLTAVPGPPPKAR